MNLTLKQVVTMLKVIDKQKYNDLEIQAKLHGMRFKMPIQANDLTQTDRAAVDDAASKLYRRMRAEYAASK